MNLFFADIRNDKIVTWDDLIRDLNQSYLYNPYCYHNDYYAVFRHIVLSILLDEEIILLDSDFSPEEVKKVTGCNRLDCFSKVLDTNKKKWISTKNDLLLKLGNNHSKWSITLFTSGTTGLPKKVKHSFQSMSRFVKSSEENKDKIWGFAYNPSHMAGIQVFFQALLNGNSIIRLFKLLSNEIFEAISMYKITHISATPTFYRLIPVGKEVFPSVIRITSGGEKFDIKTINNLKKVFPNAKVTNIYASTEAGSLLVSHGDIFSIKPEMKEWMKIENSELLIHKKLLGKIETERETSWYNTGDVVKIISENPFLFKFVFRKNEMINVGGDKVNPNEVEEAIRKIEGVIDVRVFAKKNSVLGNAICCEIERKDEDLDEFQIRLFLQSHLPEFQIPRFIKFVDKISTTRTGKIKRI